MKQLKKIIGVLMLSICVMLNSVPLAFAAPKDATNASKSIVSLSETEITMNVGDTFKLQAHGGTRWINYYTWKSSDTSVAQVSSKFLTSNYGTVKAKNAGTAIITVTSGGNKATCTVTVVDETAAHTHQYDEGVVTKEPTCTEDGVKTFTCSCGNTKTEVIEKLGHSIVNEHKDATETEPGYDREVCSRCGTIVKEAEIPVIHSHVWDNGEVTAPTCTEKGYTTYTCEVCGETKVDDYTDMTDHTGVLTNVKEATTTSEGYTGDTVCSVCGTVLAKGTTIPKIVVKSAALTTGNDFNTKMKTLAGDTDPTYNSTNTSITAFVRSMEAPDTTDFTDMNIVSAEGSDYPVYIWYNEGTIYWYSEAQKPVMNTDSSYMFSWLTKLSDVSGLYEFDDSVAFTAIKGFCWGCQSLDNVDFVSDWNVSKVTDLDLTFAVMDKAHDLTPFKNWDVSNVKSMWALFDGWYTCTDVTPLANWNVSKCYSFMNTFNHFEALTSLHGLENWDISGAGSIDSMFQHCHSLTDISAVANWNTSKVFNMQGVFRSNYVLEDISPLANWDTSNVIAFGNGTYAYAMFSYDYALKDLSPLANWDTSSVTDMGCMFEGCTSLTNISALANWDTSECGRYSRMFYGCSSLTDASALDDWDYASQSDWGGFEEGNRYNNIFKNCKNLVRYPAWDGTWDAEGTFTPNN